jgi:hypothetical protein
MACSVANLCPWMGESAMLNQVSAAVRLAGTILRKSYLSSIFGARQHGFYAILFPSRFILKLIALFSLGLL